MVGGGGGSVGLGLGVLSGSLVCNIGDISIIAVGRVLDMLDTSIGKSNRVRSGDVAGTIGLLLSVEVGLGVVISDGVGVGVGGDLIGVGLGLVGGGRGVVSGGGVNSVVDRGHNHGGVHSVVDGGHNHGGVDGVVSHGVDGVVSVVTPIRAGSHDGEESSSDESLKIGEC